MPSRRVKLGKSIQLNELEQILVDAAKEIGYKAKVSDQIREHYELGSVRRVQEYTGTAVKLSKLFIPLMEVEFDKRSPNDSLSLFYGFGFGLSTIGTVEKYLAAVSKRL